MISENTLKFKGKNTIDFIFIHGLTGSPGEFLSYIPLFKNKGNIHLISLPGHGQWKNVLKPELTYKGIMDSFHEYIKKLNKSKKIFIAHSIGGFLIDKKILNFIKNDFQMYFISPVLLEDLNEDEYKKVYEKLIDENSENLFNFYKNLRLEINDHIANYSYQKGSKFKNKIMNIYGTEDKLISIKNKEKKDNNIILKGSHNLHIDSLSSVADIILARL